MDIDWNAEYRDGRAGFVGKLLGRHEYPNGCVRITLVATEGPGKEAVEHSLDIQDLEIKSPGRGGTFIPLELHHEDLARSAEVGPGLAQGERDREPAPATGGPGTAGRARPTGRR